MFGEIGRYEKDIISKILGGDENTINEFISHMVHTLARPDNMRSHLSEAAFRHFNSVVPIIDDILEEAEPIKKSEDLTSKFKSLGSFRGKFRRIRVDEDDILVYRMSKGIKDIFTTIFSLIDELYDDLEIQKTRLDPLRKLTTLHDNGFTCNMLASYVTTLTGKLRLLFFLTRLYKERHPVSMTHVKILEGDWNDAFVNTIAEYFTTEILKDFPDGKRFRVSISEVSNEE